MSRTEIADLARTLATSEAPIPHVVLRWLAALPSSDWALVDDAVFGAIADAAAERRRADPELWEA